jgi:transcription elongation GreA/GreB family factor
MKEHLRKMAAGDYSTRIALRKRDELMDLAEIMNNLSSCLNDVTVENSHALGRAKAEVLKIKQDIENKNYENAAKDVGNLERELNSIDASLSKCKLNL